MARSRRSYRRSTSQRAVSLFASFLPTPLQRIADTQIGSTILTLGIPALIVAGILQFEWNGGLPQLTIDRNRAQEIRNAAREEFSRISSPETVQTIQRLERSAVDLWNAAQGNSPSGYPTQSYPTNASYPANPHTANGYPTAYPQPNGGYDYRAVSQQPPLPSSSVAQSASPHTQWPNAVGANPYPSAPTYYQQPYAQPSSYTTYPNTPSTTSYPTQHQPTSYQPGNYQPASYQQSQYQQTPYQQPQYQQSQPSYYQPPAPALYQQPITQQPTTGRTSRY